MADNIHEPACPPVAAAAPHDNCDARGVYKRPTYDDDGAVNGWEFVTLDPEPNHRAQYERDGFEFMGYALAASAPGGPEPNPVTGTEEPAEEPAEEPEGAPA